MPRLLLLLLLGLVPVATAPPGQQADTYTGVITDSECVDGNHVPMRMGPTDAECVLACVDAHGAAFVLYDGRRSYALSDQRAPAAWAGKRVTVTGTLDAAGRTIEVRSIAAAR